MTLRDWMLVIIVSAVAALFAFATIPPQRTFTPDNLAYFDMASGKPAQAPFCFRILVPSIARLLPLSPPIALRLITYVCMAGVYLCGLYLCRLEGINLAASFGGLLLFYCSRPHLFTYYNPYLSRRSRMARHFWPMYYLRETTVFLLHCNCGDWCACARVRLISLRGLV